MVEPVNQPFQPEVVKWYNAFLPSRIRQFDSDLLVKTSFGFKVRVHPASFEKSRKTLSTMIGACPITFAPVV